jgi:hypothetical protein
LNKRAKQGNFAGSPYEVQTFGTTQICF